MSMQPFPAPKARSFPLIKFVVLPKALCTINYRVMNHQPLTLPDWLTIPWCFIMVTR